MPRILVLVLLAWASVAEAQIATSPSTITFTGVAGGARPPAITVVVRTASGVAWSSQDTCSFFDAVPTSGASGGSHRLTPSSGWDALPLGTTTCPITYRATGQPNLVIQVSGVKTPAVPAQYPGKAVASVARVDVTSWTLGWTWTASGTPSQTTPDIERGPCAGPFTPLISGAPGSILYEDRNVLPGQVYGWRVRGRIGSQVTAYSNVVCNP